MATANPFDLLGIADNDDPEVIAALTKKNAAADAQPAKKPAAALDVKQAKLPSKPLPPSQAVFVRSGALSELFVTDHDTVVRESRNDSGRGSGRGSRGRGGRGGGFSRDAVGNEGSYNGYAGGYSKPTEEEREQNTERRSGYGGPPRSGFRGSRRGGFSNGEDADNERPRRNFERRSGTGRGNEVKREGAGRGNWGTPSDDVAPETVETDQQKEKIVDEEKPAGEEGAAAEVKEEKPAEEPVEQDPDEKLMTLEEYEKQLEEKRKAMLADKPEERKVDDKEFQSMQQLSNKKSNDDIFIKLRSDKDKQRKEAADKDEKAKKAVSINEFLKPAEGARYYGGGRRGRGRGGQRGGGYDEGNRGAPRQGGRPAEFNNDPSLFPSLGGN